MYTKVPSVNRGGFGGVVMSGSPNSWDFGPSFGMIHTLSKAQKSTY